MTNKPLKNLQLKIYGLNYFGMMGQSCAIAHTLVHINSLIFVPDYIYNLENIWSDD
jgi:hypothetical protein